MRNNKQKYIQNKSDRWYKSNKHLLYINVKRCGREQSCFCHLFVNENVDLSIYNVFFYK